MHNDPNLFGPLTALVKDPSVSDVIVANPDVVLVRKGSRTEASGVVFSGQAALLETLVDRLLTAAGTAYSIAKPIADGNIGQQIRVHAVNPVLCEKGPYLTIRISRFKSVKYSDLVSYGMISP